MAHAGSTYLIDETKRGPSPAAPEIVFFFWPASIPGRCKCIQILCPEDGGDRLASRYFRLPRFDSPWANMRLILFNLAPLKMVHLTLRCGKGEWRQIRFTLATILRCLRLLKEVHGS